MILSVPSRSLCESVTRYITCRSGAVRRCWSSATATSGGGSGRRPARTSGSGRRALVGLLASVGGYGLFLAAESVEYGTGAFWTYRTLAGGIAGLGLPAFLLGLVVALPEVRRNTYVSLVGSLLCAAGIVLSLATYPDQWNVAGSPDYVVETVTVYGLGAMLRSAAGGAVNCHFENEEITGFIRGSPPEG